MPEIVFDDVSTLYGGRDEQAALALLHNGADAATLRAQAGASVGLNRVSLTIPDGGIFCVMGLSGSGKSTLIRHINGLIRPSSGTVRVGDTVVNQLDAAGLRQFRQQQVDMVFQHFGLLPHLTVLQNVAYGLRVRGESSQQRDAKARHWLAEVQLPDVEQRYPDELSGGMQQRVGLARALAMDAPVLLMDEAFSALDPLIRSKLQQQLLELQARLRKTIVFVTHDMGEAVRIGQQIAILRAGQLVQAGTPEHLRAQPVDAYVSAFMRGV